MDNQTVYVVGANGEYPLDWSDERINIPRKGSAASARAGIGLVRRNWKWQHSKRSKRVPVQEEQSQASTADEDWHYWGNHLLLDYCLLLLHLRGTKLLLISLTGTKGITDCVWRERIRSTCLYFTLYHCAAGVVFRYFWVKSVLLTKALISRALLTVNNPRSSGTLCRGLRDDKFHLTLTQVSPSSY